jgi:hypothetical protein
VSIALFAVAAAIWAAIIVPAVARRLRAERAAGPPAVALRGDRLGHVRRLPAPEHRPARRRPHPAVARRRRLLAGLGLLAVAALRAGAAFGGRWWLAAAVAGGLPMAYLAALAGSRRRAGRARRAARRLPAPAAGERMAWTE